MPSKACKMRLDALRLKEYQHERISKGEVLEEKAEEISKVLLNLEKGDKVSATYFEDGHNKEISGEGKLLIEEQCLKVGNKKINLDDILYLKRI